MLHKRELPTDIRRDLKQVHIKQLRLMKWLLTSPPAVLDETTLSMGLGKEFGTWLCQRIWCGNTETAYGKTVLALCRKVHADIKGASKVWDAIKNDVSFNQRWDDSTFQFVFPSLPMDWRVAVKPVLTEFYEWLVNLGFEQSIFSLRTDKLDRISILRGYRNNHARVCGYCDGAAGDMTDYKAADHIEHFFPKGNYPHLSIHPDNLFAACSGCNTIWKLQENPVTQLRMGMLEDTYHPRLKPGRVDIHIQVQPDPANWSKFMLNLTDTIRPERTINMNRMLDLDSRWSERVNTDLKRSRSMYVATRIDASFDEASVKACINADKQACINWVDKRAEQLLHIAVLDFQANSSDEIQSILCCHT